MKKKDLDTLRKMLEDEKTKILRHLEALSDSAEEDLDQGSGDQVDIASLEINQANIQKIGKRETFLLKKIDLALKKMDEGTYGECESCGEEISVARLMARPVAQLCIDCKTEQESMERRYSAAQESEEEDDIIEEGDEY
ncbi:MAG: TraR/DksA family transcriptional regulator [Deltaproteobacteria bacterium]|nr:TraR/DksA family transcriptional regulator [Deltaproteobacteria bacterium]